MNTTFGLGKTLATGFRIWIRNLLPFTLLTVMVYAPLLLWGVMVAGADQSNFDSFVNGIVTFEKYSFLLALPLGILVSAAVTYGVVMELQGQRASIGACIAIGLKRFLPAIGTLILLALCFLGVGIVVGIPVAAIAGVVGPAGLIFAYLVIGVVMLWLYSMMYVSMQVSVIERPGISASLGRSRDLTSGHKLAIAILVIVLGAINFGLLQLTQQLTIPGGHFSGYIYLTLARDVLTGSLGSVMAAVAYSLLRGEKEGTTADELAQIFG